MKGERQISFDGTVNNANNRGGGGDGLTARNAAGLKYKNEWNEKISADGWYNFEDVTNNTISTGLTQNFLQSAAGDFTRLENSRNNNTNKRNNHVSGVTLSIRLIP